MEAIAQRLYDYFFKHKGYKNDTVVANQLNYSHPEKISRLFRDGSSAKPSVDILEDITNKFGNELNIEWVLTGRGTMIKAGSEVAYSLNDPGNGQYKTKPASIKMPDLITLRKQIDSALFSLEEARKMLPVPFGPETRFGDPFFDQSGKKKKT